MYQPITVSFTAIELIESDLAIMQRYGLSLTERNSIAKCAEALRLAEKRGVDEFIDGMFFEEEGA